MLLETEEEGAVPARSGNQAGDLREAPVLLSLMCEAVLEHSDFLRDPLPFPTKTVPGLSFGPTA
jgi:hypothetical protein